MTPKLIIISDKYVRWLLPAALLLVLVLGFLQTPRVRTFFDPDFLWKDQLFRLQREKLKADNNLKWLSAELDNLKTGQRPGPGELRQLKKGIVSVTNSLYFMDAMLANLTKEVQAGLPQAAPARRAQLLAYLQKVKTLQIHCGENHHRLQKISQRVHHLSP